MDELREQYQTKLQDVKGIQVTATPLYDTIASGVRQELPVLVRIMAGKQIADIERKPMNVSVVLDRSGSMDGNKLENSKKAVNQLISLLKEEDRLHFVIYDNKVETILTNVSSATAKDSLQKVDEVKAGGCTDLFAGVQRGVDLVVKHHQEGMLDVVFLFSDGQANNGIMGTEKIGHCIKELHAEHGVRFITFGIGSDYNEKLMSSIARVGKGNYFFIDNMERIPELVSKAYSGFTNVVAEKLVLKVRGVGGTVLDSLSGCDNPVAGKSYDMMREYGFYQLLATCTVSPSAEFTMVSSTPVLSWQLTFNDLQQSGQSVTQIGTVEVKLTEGFDTPVQQPAPAVVVFQTMVDCSALNEEATLALGVRDRSKAVAAKKQVIAKYEEVLDLDDFGFVAALLKKERDALVELEREGVTDRTTKMCGYTTTSMPSRYTDRCDYEADEEDDEDMGFGYFD